MRLALIFLLAASGCTTQVALGSNDARVLPDGATHATCGARQCNAGEDCCSPACGTCAAAGSCPAIITFCPDAGNGCAADSVALSGSHVCSSYVWNGLDCVQAYGCTCVGDCAQPQPTYAACMTLHGGCWSPSCNSARFCPNDFFCERGSCGDSAGTCIAVPEDCSTMASSPTCGCDGFGYRSPCDAQRAAQTIVPTPTCGVCNLPAITLAPGCTTSLGWAWNGARCVEQFGCSCTGPCDRLEASESACLSRYQPACASYFPCGATSCSRGTQYCDSGACIALGACAPSCACVMPGVGQTCDDDGAGAIVITP